MTPSKRPFDYCDQIRARVDNWTQGEGYGPGGFSKDTAEHDVVYLLNRIADLEEKIADLMAEAGEAAAWRGRYNALLEEAEASRPREIDGGDVSRGVTARTIVVDRDGYPWISHEGRWWQLVKEVASKNRTELHPLLGPYTIVYTPKEKS